MADVLGALGAWGKGFALSGLLAAGAVLAQPAPATPAVPAVQPAPMFSPTNPFGLPPLPQLPHELRLDSWPQPDYFQEALKLTARTPRERVAEPRLRLPSARAKPEAIVLPVQTQAFGFAPPFRALMGATLDAQLERHGVPATLQTDIVDAYGPSVRRLSEESLTALQKEYGARLIALYLGHDGADTMFATLVVREASARRVAHRSLALPADAAQAGRALAEQLPAMLAELKLAAGAPARPATRAEACSAAAWQLPDAAAPEGALQRACAALVVGSLMPDFDFSGQPGAAQSTESRLAWLARAQVQAEQVQPPTETSQALRQLAAVQLDASLKLPPGVAGLASSPDPVLSKVSRLVGLALAGAAPVRSKSEAKMRQMQEVAEGLPALPAAAVIAAAQFSDVFGEVDVCAFERAYPGGMVSPNCRQGGPGADPGAARPATRPEALLYQEWRLAAWYHDLHKRARTLGDAERARALASGLPRDVADHPFMRRLLVSSQVGIKPTGSYDDLLRDTRQRMDDMVQSVVDLQRNDKWARRYSAAALSSFINSNMRDDPQVVAIARDDARLQGVLKFDRFFSGPLDKPFRRKPGEGAYFLRPDGQSMQFEFGLAQSQHLVDTAVPAAVAASSPDSAPAYVPTSPRPLFSLPYGTRLPMSPDRLARSLAEVPNDLGPRVKLAFAQLRRGGPVSEAMALIAAHPPNQRSDERVADSHAWAVPAHAFFFAGETEAAQRAYEKVNQIGSGSDSHLQAIARSLQLRGDFDAALQAHERRQRRYESDYGRRDVAGMLFMKRRPQEAWDLLLPRASMGRSIQLWNGILVGHRIEGLDAAAVREWVGARGFAKVQVDSVDVVTLYPHLAALLDRVPTLSEVSMLGQRGEGVLYVPRYWQISALLARTAILGDEEASVLKHARDTVKEHPTTNLRFMLPNYAWVAWRATQGRDDVLDAVRELDADADFHGLLAKSIVLGLDGRTDESLRFLRAARFELVGLNAPRQISEEPIPVAYQLALAGQMLYQHTGQDAYRRETLTLAQAYQTVFPFMAWPYALEALLEKDAARRRKAGCRAQFLDAKSYFLQRAALTGLTPAACKAALW